MQAFCWAAIGYHLFFLLMFMHPQFAPFSTYNLTEETANQDLSDLRSVLLTRRDLSTSEADLLRLKERDWLYLDDDVVFAGRTLSIQLVSSFFLMRSAESRRSLLADIYLFALNQYSEVQFIEVAFVTYHRVGIFMLQHAKVSYIDVNNATLSFGLEITNRKGDLQNWTSSEMENYPVSYSLEVLPAPLERMIFVDHTGTVYDTLEVRGRTSPREVYSLEAGFTFGTGSGRFLNSFDDISLASSKAPTR